MTKKKTAHTLNESDTINSVELQAEAKRGSLKGLRIEQIVSGEEEEYHVHALLAWRAKPLTMCTRRKRTEARSFKSLERLVTFIQQTYPTVSKVEIELSRAPSIPTKKTAKKAAKKPDKKVAKKVAKATKRKA